MKKLTMLPEELQELLADIAHVKLQDFHLGGVLEKFAVHLAHAHGIEPDAQPEETTAGEDIPAAEEETAPAPASVVKGKVK